MINLYIAYFKMRYAQFQLSIAKIRHAFRQYQFYRKIKKLVNRERKHGGHAVIGYGGDGVHEFISLVWGNSIVWAWPMDDPKEAYDKCNAVVKRFDIPLDADGLFTLALHDICQGVLERAD